ncbi:MAG: hypothetical protein JJT76_15210 [Clostridiaceae bacterium]|nr:hypothetical protein [Clostridiaceae bacterium]
MEEKTSISTIILIIAVFFGVLTLFMLAGEHFNSGMLVFFYIACGLGFIIKPSVDMWENSKKRHITLQEKVLLGVRILLVAVAIQAFYIIFISLIYELYWSYWVLLLSFVLLAVVEKIQQSTNQDEYNEEAIEAEEEQQEEQEQEQEETKGKLWKKVKRLVYILISASLLYYQHYTPPYTLETESLILPKSVTVSLVEERQEPEPTGMFPHKRTEIMEENTDEALITPLWQELQQGNIDNLRYINSLNYSKMKRVYGQYYSIYVAYEGTKRDLEAQGELIDFIYVYPNGKAYLSRYNFNRRRVEIFPVNIPMETIENFNISI